MPRVALHAPCYHTDAAGTRWRVYDLAPSAAPGRPRLFARPGCGPAIARWFVREGDRWTFIGAFDGDDPRDCSPTILERQLSRALRHAPRMRRGEAMPDYLARQQAHLKSRPDLFTPGGHRRPAPDAPQDVTPWSAV